MKHLKKSIVIGFMAISFLFQAGTAQAQIPIPTIGAELATQIAELTQHIQELMKVKDQIMKNIQEAKAIGDKLSLDAIKQLIKGQAAAALNGATVAMKLSQDFKNLGFTEDTLKDPEKISSKFDDVQRGLHEGEFDLDKRKACWAARDSMLKSLVGTNLANTMGMESYVSSGEGMKDVQDASGSTEDQAQLISTNTATNQAIYKQMSSTTAMIASNMASGVLSKMCD